MASFDKPASTATAANISTNAETTTAINLMMLVPTPGAFLPSIALLWTESFSPKDLTEKGRAAAA
jgi:hypothetical protein